MSEYQYYEFQAIDRPLSERDRAELRAISTRAEITPTSFTNTYNWGDLKADPIDLLAKYFDAFLYVANWGTHRLAFRFPADALDLDTVRAYAEAEWLPVRRRKEIVLIEFRADIEEPEGWEEGYGLLGHLSSLRADLLHGDLRALYLGWLAGVQRNETQEGMEPPLPAGLAELSAPLTGLADFLWLDADLFAAAAEGSDPLSQQTPESEAKWRSWIGALSESEKDELLYRVASGDASVPWELRRRFRRRGAGGSLSPAGRSASERRRDVRQIVDAARELTEQRRRRLAEERARRARRRAAERKRYLQDLATRDGAVRAEVESLIQSRQQPNYDRAVQLLKDLRDAAALQGGDAAFEAYAADLRRLHARKTTLIRRFDKAGL